MLLLTVGVSSICLCPPHEDILPCSCTYETGHIKVLCWKVKSLTFRIIAHLTAADLRVAVLAMLFAANSIPLRLCPPREDILPCSCTHETGHIKVFCWKVSSLRPSFSEGNELRFLDISRPGSLHVGGSGVGELGNEWFSEFAANLNKHAHSRAKLGDRVFAPRTNLRTPPLRMGRNEIEMPKRSMFPSLAEHLETHRLRHLR